MTMEAALSPVRALGASVLAAARSVGVMAIFIGRGLGAALTPPFYPDQILRQLFQIGFLSLPVVGLTAVFVGAALVLNIYTGGARFNAESFVPNIVALGITRELGPVLAGLMLAGRVSAGIAAELGAMRVSEQIDALSTLSTNPMRFLVGPRLLAGALTLPLLVLIADIIGIMGGYVVATQALGFNGAMYLRNTWAFIEPQDVTLGIVKAFVFGLIISSIGCFFGYNSQGGAGGVGRAATYAVVVSAVLILASNYAITTFFVE